MTMHSFTLRIYLRIFTSSRYQQKNHTKELFKGKINHWYGNNKRAVVELRSQVEHSFALAITSRYPRGPAKWSSLFIGNNLLRLSPLRLSSGIIIVRTPSKNSLYLSVVDAYVPRWMFHVSKVMRKASQTIIIIIEGNMTPLFAAGIFPCGWAAGKSCYERQLK